MYAHALARNIVGDGSRVRKLFLPLNYMASSQFAFSWPGGHSKNLSPKPFECDSERGAEIEFSNWKESGKTHQSSHPPLSLVRWFIAMFWFTLRWANAVPIRQCRHGNPRAGPYDPSDCYWTSNLVGSRSTGVSEWSESQVVVALYWNLQAAFSLWTVTSCSIRLVVDWKYISCRLQNRETTRGGADTLEVHENISIFIDHLNTTKWLFAIYHIRLS